MNKFLKIFSNCKVIIGLLSVLSLFFSDLSGQARSPIQLPDVVASAGIIKRTIQIESSNPQVASTANQFFSLHGGFELTSSQSKADFVFEYVLLQPGTVKLAIESGGKGLWTQTFKAPTTNRAVALASDVCVQKTLGIQGFFASKIGFISTRTGHAEVYTSDLLFNEIKQLTRDRNQCLSPDLSPDGKVILYTSYHGTGFPDIYRIDLNSGRRTVFAGFQGTNTGADFSPDGRSVAMILSGERNSELFVSNNSGGQLRRLTRTESLESDPSWSPDGSRIVLTSDQLGQPQIYTIKSSGREFRRVRTDISRHCSEPDWNPQNADQFAFTAAVAGEFEVCVFEFNKGKSTILSKGAGDAVHPEWLNDGRHLIYTHRTPRYSRLMILDTLTGKQSRLSPVDLNDASQATAAYID